MRLLATTFFLVFFTVTACSQSYKLTTAITPSAFQPLGEGDSTLAMPWGSDDTYGSISLPGDTMAFFGAKYPLDLIGVSYTGYLVFQNENSAIFLDVFTSLLDSTNPLAKVKYKVMGEQAARSIVVDWQNVGMTSCPSDVVTNFQVVLSLKDGVFMMNYGPGNTVCDSAYGGGTGPFVGIFRTTPDFFTINKIFWLSGDPQSPKVTMTAIPMLQGTPISGLSYIFTPPSADVAEQDQLRSALRSTVVGQSLKIMFEASPDDRSLRVCDMLGKTVATLAVHSGSTEVSVSYLPKGAYIVKLGDDHLVIVR